MRFNSCNLGDKAILRGLGNREDEAGAGELLSFQVCFNHFNLANASCSHLAHQKKKKKQEKKKRKTSRCWCWSSQTLDSEGDGELTWHDGVRDVEVVQGQAQGLTRGGRGRAGGLGGRPGRFDGRGGRRGVAAGLELIVLGLERLDLVLLVDKRFKKKEKKKEFERKSKSASAAGSDSTAWAGLCCYSESVLLELKAISAFFDLQGPLCSEGWGSDKEPYTWSPDLRWDYRLPQTRQPNVCGNPLNRRRLRGCSLTARCFVEREKKKTLNNPLWTETGSTL